jgi:hypothetical protein
MSIKRAGMVASLILMLFLLTGGYYVQVYTSVSTHSVFFFLIFFFQGEKKASMLVQMNCFWLISRLASQIKKAKIMVCL